MPGHVPRPDGHGVPTSPPELDAAGAGGEEPAAPSATAPAIAAPAEVVAAFGELGGLPVWSVWSWWWWPLTPDTPPILVGHCVIGAGMCSLFLDSPELSTLVWTSIVTHNEVFRCVGPLHELVPRVVAELNRAAHGHSP